MRCRVLVLLLLLVAGCATIGAREIGGPVESVPDAHDPLDIGTWRARQLFEAGQERDALALVEDVLQRAPGHMDGQRVRQDILRRRGRMGRLLWESEQRLAAEAESADALYLAGRLALTDRDKRGWFTRAVNAAPRSFWAWLGMAFALRGTDPARAVAIYRWLYEASDEHPLAAIALAAALRESDPAALGFASTESQLNAALEIYSRLREHPLAGGIGELGIAQTLQRSEHGSRAWPPLLQALKLRPFDSGVQALIEQSLARGLPLDQIHQVIDIVQRDAERLRQFTQGGGRALLAALYAAAGEPFAARAALQERGAGTEPPQLHRQHLLLTLRTGDVPGFLAGLRAGYPASLLQDERNQLRGLWKRLLHGPWADAPDPLAEPDMARALCEALLHTGLIDAAETVGTMAWLRHGASETAPALRALYEEARRELAFERAVRRVLYHGYASAAAGDLDRVLEELRRISVEILGADVVGTPRRFHIPLVGDLLDPFEVGLCGHFARYNRYFILGQRSGRPAEGMLLTRLSVREIDPVAELPLDAPAREVIGEDRQIRSLTGIYGGDLAGVALINHYVVDMDSVRDWANEIRERRRVAREDGDELLRDPLPERVSDLEPASAPWLLSVLSPVPDSALDDAVLDLIRWHEHAHLVDVFHYLPVENNVWRVLGLFLRHGFAREAIEADMEARAEVASLALSPYTMLVLAHIAVFLESAPGESVHASGFRRLAAAISERLAARGADGRVSRWHLLDPEVVRQIGLEMLQQQW